MKKLIFVIFLLLQYGCIFTYDPPRGFLYIRNNTDEAMYVYFKCGNIDSLPLYPELKLFYFSSANMKDVLGNPIEPHFVSPDYRINAYYSGSIAIWGTPYNPSLPCDEKKATLFFITEKTMRNYDWEEIYENQMFVKKVILTEEELKNMNWKYIYSP